jgi:hypothetical protein
MHRLTGTPIAHATRLLTSALLGLGAVALLACGSSGKGLIPASAAGPLQGDFEAIATAAQAGDGECAATNEAIAKAEQDFAALPVTVDRGLRERIRTGLANLSSRGRAICAQPAPTTTATSTPTSTTSSSTTTTTSSTPSTTSTSSTTTSTATVPSTPTETTPAPAGGTPPEGGTPAPPGPSENGGAGGEGNGK